MLKNMSSNFKVFKKIIISFLFCFFFLHSSVLCVFSDDFENGQISTFSYEGIQDYKLTFDDAINFAKDNDISYLTFDYINVNGVRGVGLCLLYDNSVFPYVEDYKTSSGYLYKDSLVFRNSDGNIDVDGNYGFIVYVDGKKNAISSGSATFLKGTQILGNFDIYYSSKARVPNNAYNNNGTGYIENYTREELEKFKFPHNQAYFYTPQNNSTVNFHFKDKYFWKFNARIYLQFDGDMYISDKKIMEKLISTMEISSPFELYEPVGTYVERPGLFNGFKAKAYIDFKVGFPSDFEFKEYTLSVSFPGSGTTSIPDVKPATVKIKLENDGSKLEGVYDNNGVIDGDGSNSTTDITGDSVDNFPVAPGSDGTIGEWFKYVGELVVWLVTYPFKLLGDVFNVLGIYINSMISQLEETARAINGLLTFIPQDILNVVYGFISFTLLYSVVRGVLKLIRG